MDSASSEKLQFKLSEKINSKFTDLFQKNKHIRRNEGAELSDDQKHQKRDAITIHVIKNS